MELNDLINKLKEELPDKAIDISESLDLLNETVQDSIEAINHKNSTALKNRNYDHSRLYVDMAEKADSYIKSIQTVINMLEVEPFEVKDETEEEEEKKIIPNYAAYIVDSNVEHTLHENFTHIRPAAFKINDHHIVEAKTWQNMLMKTCEFLMAIDEKKFLSFENNRNMNGRKNKYFSTNPSNMRKASFINNKIYIEMNQSGNAIRNLIIKLLKEYGFKISDYKVYFRADYSSLNE